jgi:thermitase
MKKNRASLLALLLVSTVTSVTGARSSSQGWGFVTTDSLKAQRIDLGTQIQPLVAIIDTGVDQRHSALNGKLWINPGESGIDSSGQNRATNRIDDDGNGFIDDVNGWNFISGTPAFEDQNGHGTHIAGIISTIAPKARLMILKYYDPQNQKNNLAMTIKAIRYAIKMKADVINFSGGGFGKSRQEEQALADAERAGILVVAAAGNEGLNSDFKGYYPADYDLANIISVASLNKNLNLLPSSNYGKKTVDLAAPGGEIISSLPGNLEGEMTGTSQATAFVSGAAALLLQDESLRGQPERLKDRLLASGTADSQLQKKTKSGVRLNTYRALAMKDQTTTAIGLSFTQDSALAKVPHAGLLAKF